MGQYHRASWRASRSRTWYTGHNNYTFVKGTVSPGHPGGPPAPKPGTHVIPIVGYLKGQYSITQASWRASRVLKPGT